MNITGLPTSFLSGQLKLNQPQEAGAGTGSLPFASAIRTAIDSINTQQKGASQEIVKTLTGDSPDWHKTIVTLQTADLNFQFGLQVRNKIIGAYEEIMRMQV